MNRKSKLFGIGACLLLILVVLYSLQGCAPKKRVLNMAVVPVDDAISTQEKYQLFVDYIEEGIGMEVNFMPVVSYAATVEAMKYGHADIARLGPLAYVQAVAEAEVEPLVKAISKTTGQPFYYSLIISRPDLETLEGATFAYVDPGSMSGYGAPSVYIRNSGIELGKIMFAGSHPAVIEAVKNGSVDAGAIADTRWTTALREGVIATDTLKIFATSDPIPYTLWTVQADMDPELREALLITFLNMPEEVVFALGANEMRFVIANDSDYDVVRQVWEAMD